MTYLSIEALAGDKALFYLTSTYYWFPTNLSFSFFQHPFLRLAKPLASLVPLIMASKEAAN